LSISTPEQKEAVDKYVAEASSWSDMDRTSSKEKTGVFMGGYTPHPISGERVPIWVGNYVLGSYGTGAVMAVPAHDSRDFEFAHAFGLELSGSSSPRKENSTKKKPSRSMVSP
jgi:leucyl-tRNA synthetase